MTRISLLPDIVTAILRATARPDLRNIRRLNLGPVEVTLGGEIALLKIAGDTKFQSSIDWNALREPIHEELVYLATSDANTNFRVLQTCAVTNANGQEPIFDHDC